MTQTYTLRSMDPSFWRNVKILAAKRGTSIRSLIIELLKEAIRKENEK